MIDLLEAEVQRRFGLLPRAEWPETMSQAIDRYSATGVAGTSEAADHRGRLLEDPDLLRELAGRLTVDESYFFRQEPDLGVVVRHLRVLLEQGRERVSVLSAGCARGEEPYSVAITADQSLGASLTPRLAILACDINGDAIATARRGVYREWSLRGVSELVLQRYFEPGAGATWQLRPELRQAVRFEHLAVHEQLQRLVPGSLDVILFRNVAVYLEAEALQRLYQALASRLRPGGLLIIAATDPRPAGDQLEPAPQPMGTLGAGTVLRRLLPTEAPAPPPRPVPDRRRARTRRGRRPIHWKLRAQPEKPGDAADPCSTLAQAIALADTGHADEALALAASAIEHPTTSAAGYRLSGLIHLEQERSDLAVEALRSALFLASEDRICRYWYAVALDQAGRPVAAMRELRMLDRVLITLSVNTLLEDEQTTCGELRRAVADLRKTLI